MKVSLYLNYSLKWAINNYTLVNKYKDTKTRTGKIQTNTTHRIISKTSIQLQPSSTKLKTKQNNNNNNIDYNWLTRRTDEKWAINNSTFVYKYEETGKIQTNTTNLIIRKTLIFYNTTQALQKNKNYKNYNNNKVDKQNQLTNDTNHRKWAINPSTVVYKYNIEKHKRAKLIQTLQTVS